MRPVAFAKGCPDPIGALKQADKGSMDDTIMTRTNELIETALKIIDALERMSM